MGKKFNQSGSNQTIILNTLSTTILQGITFLTLPFFTRLLGTSQYGIFSLFNSWVSILICIMGLNIYSSIGAGFYEFKEKYTDFRNSNLLLTTIIGGVQLALIVIFSREISNLISLNQILVILIGIAAFGHYIILFSQCAFIYEKKPLNNFVLSIAYSVLSTGLSFILILFVKNENRYLARSFGVAISYMFIALLVWIYLFREKPTGIKKKYSEFGIRVGTPIIFHALSLNILNQSDRVMMQMYGYDASYIGIYSLFYTFSSVLTVLLSALNNSWCPFYYEYLNNEKWDALKKKVGNYIELFTILSIGFLLLSKEVLFIIADKSYWSGINVLPILVIIVYFTFMYQFPVNFEFFHKKTKIIAIGTIIAGILNIILNSIMIPKWNMYGAAIATGLSYLSLFFVHYFIVKHMNYHLKVKDFYPGLVVLSIGCLAFYILSPFWYLRWTIGIILGCYEVNKFFKRKSIF